MKFGFNLLLWTSFVTEKHFPLFEKLKAAGYDGVEIPVLEGTPEHYRTVLKVARDNGLECNVITNMPGVDCNPISPVAAYRERALAFMKMVTDCAQALETDLVAGPFYQPVGLFSGTGPTDVEKQRASDVLRKSAEYAGRAGITLAVEFLNRFEAYFLTTMDGVAEHIASVDMPNYKAMFDTFHANIEENNSGESIRRHRELITHVHVSENTRGTPGSGQVDWKGVFAALKQTGYDKWLTVEAFGRVLPAFAAATKIWRDIFESPEALYTGAIRFLRESWKEDEGGN